MSARIRIDRQKILRLLAGWPVQLATSQGLIELQEQQLPWKPMVQLRPTPPHIIQARKKHGMSGKVQVWSNGEYECWVERDVSDDEGTEGMIWLSIKRMDRAPVHNWRHLQQIKNEVLGPEWEAVELYPAESRLADNANQTHLWAVNTRLPFGFQAGLVTFGDDAENFTQDPSHRGKQEPRQSGLTVGDTMLEVQRREKDKT